MASWGGFSFFFVKYLLKKKNNKIFSFFFHSFVLNSLKMECEKLVQEKTEMQRHYVMVSREATLLIIIVISDLK